MVLYKIPEVLNDTKTGVLHGVGVHDVPFDADKVLVEGAVDKLAFRCGVVAEFGIPQSEEPLSLLERRKRESRVVDVHVREQCAVGIDEGE